MEDGIGQLFSITVSTLITQKFASPEIGQMKNLLGQCKGFFVDNAEIRFARNWTDEELVRSMQRLFVTGLINMEKINEQLNFSGSIRVEFKHRRNVLAK